MEVIYLLLALVLGIGGYLWGKSSAGKINAALDTKLQDEARAEATRIQQTAETQARQIQEEANQTKTEAQRKFQEAEEKERRSQEQVQQQQEQLRQQQGQLQTLREQLESDRTQFKQDTQRERETLSQDRQETRREREELKREIERLNRRAEQLDARGDKLDGLEEKLEAHERALADHEETLLERSKQIDLKLYEVANLTPEVAREQILTQLDNELTDEKAVRVKAMYERAASEAKKMGREIIAQAIQRSASETSAQLSVSVVPIPSDGMKGRLIGREGRNIRAFEALTGVDLIIDDTPEAVILSSFNPIRREVARHVLEALVGDGRIHPTRIEEMVHKAQDEMKNFIYSQGEEAAIEAGVMGVKPGLIQLLGRMYFRSSYGQNVLKHSVQVAHLTGIMADELGLDAALARRAGLMHDIGKSIDREIEGTHVDIGINLAKRFGEPTEVIDGIAHHHDPENGETLYSVLVAAADAISAARPGARREELEAYVRRLEQLEQIAVAFPGVQQAYAIQAGREVRVIVQPEKVSDAQATLLARDIAGRVEQDMEYPGQVQVTVVRESRAVEVAR